MIKEARLFHPIMPLVQDLKLHYLPSIGSNQFLRLHLGNYGNCIYLPTAIFYEMPNTFYLKLRFNKTSNDSQNNPLPLDFREILIIGLFEEGNKIKCDSDKFLDLEFPQIPGRNSYIIYKPNEDETKYFECKEVEIRSNTKNPFLYVEEDVNITDLNDFINRKAGVTIK